MNILNEWNLVRQKIDIYKISWARFIGQPEFILLFSNKILPLEVALISGGSRPLYWRAVFNVQNLVKRVEGNQDGYYSSNRNMDQPTPGCMEWTIYIINYRINDNNIIPFKCLRYVQSMDRQVHRLTGCWELRIWSNLNFFAITCGHGTNKTLKKLNTRVGTFK